MKINKKKKKALVRSREQHKNRKRLNIGGENIEEMEEFHYLGSQITTYGKRKRKRKTW